MNGVREFKLARNVYSKASESIIQQTIKAAKRILSNVETDVEILLWFVFGAHNDERYIDLKHEFKALRNVENVGVPHNAVFIFLHKFLKLLKELNICDGQMTYNVEGYERDASYYFESMLTPNFENPEGLTLLERFKNVELNVAQLAMHFALRVSEAMLETHIPPMLNGIQNLQSKAKPRVSSAGRNP